MTKFVTSDLHLNHSRILEFCPITRPFELLDQMNEWIISEWNMQVSEDDTVYILGDVAFGPLEPAIELISRLQGCKILVVGNHDYKFLKHSGFIELFSEIHEYLEIKHNKKNIVMSHYPILYWNRGQYGSIMLHGHLHDDQSGLEDYRVMNVGIDSTGKVVVPLDLVIETLKNKPKREHHLKN